MCMYVPVSARVRMRIRVRVRACTNTCAARACVCPCVHACVRIQIGVRTCAYLCVRIRVRIRVEVIVPRLPKQYLNIFLMQKYFLLVYHTYIIHIGPPSSYVFISSLFCDNLYD